MASDHHPYYLIVHPSTYMSLGIRKRMISPEVFSAALLVGTAVSGSLWVGLNVAIGPQSDSIPLISLGIAGLLTGILPWGIYWANTPGCKNLQRVLLIFVFTCVVTTITITGATGKTSQICFSLVVFGGLLGGAIHLSGLGDVPGIIIVWVGILAGYLGGCYAGYKAIMANGLPRPLSALIVATLCLICLHKSFLMEAQQTPQYK
jgi:hypothetical protein